MAYDEVQGEAELGGPARFVALFGVDDGLLNVMLAPDVSRIEDLRGRAVSVDALTSGFAFILRDVLSRRGLRDSDVNWQRVGSGAQRLAALLKGDQAATLLNTPLDLAAEARGFRRMLRFRDEIGAYQGIVGLRSHAGAWKQSLGSTDSVFWRACPSSDDLRLFWCLRNGGSGSSGFEVMRPAADGASVSPGWSGA